MDSALIDFLKKDYPAHFGQEWKEDTMQVRREQRPKGKFEIRDGQLQIVHVIACCIGVSLDDHFRHIGVEAGIQQDRKILGQKLGQKRFACVLQGILVVPE